MTRTLTGNWNYPTPMWSGPDRIKELGAACKQLGITRPLFVTDRGLRDMSIVSEAMAVLEEASLPAALYSEVQGNPLSDDVINGVKAYHDHDADGVVAFGGGSGVDVGKTIAFMAGQTRPLFDFEDVGDWWTRADADAIAPIIAVPTTAGTGSEVGRASVITDPDTHEKKIIFHPKMLPGLVINDPALTVGLPPHLTAATGLDAFIHCFEAYCAPGYHPMADGIALEGMRLVQTALPAAFAEGSDIDARADMLSAASMGATAFQKGLGGVHSISHAVGATYNTHHGLTNAIVLPYIMKVNEHAIAERMPLLARILDLKDQSFAGVYDWVLEFRQALEIPETLSAIDVPTDRSDRIGELAERDPTAGTNPIKLSAETYAETFVKAVNGS